MVALLKMPDRFTAQSAAERRMFPRKEIHLQVEGRRLDHSVEARQEPRLSLALRDLSMGGLSAISPKALAAGERVNVFFPPRGPQRGWDASGHIIRCDPSAMGYRI